MKNLTCLILALSTTALSSRAALVEHLADEGWNDLGLITGNSFGNYSFEFGAGPLGVSSVQLNALGSVGTPAMATLEKLSGINIATFDGVSTYDIEALSGTYTTWAESAVAGSTPNLKFSLFTSDTYFNSSDAMMEIALGNMTWASTLVYLPTAPSPTVGAWVDNDVSSDEWWWTGAAQTRASYESWIDDIFASRGGSYLYIATVQLGLGGSTNTKELVGHVDKMEIGFGLDHSMVFDFGIVAVPEPSTYGLAGALLLVGLVSYRRFQTRARS